MWTLGPFELERPLARGGMGEVWRATHRELGQPVAVKVVRADRADAAALRAARAEVEAVAALDHPNIVRIFDFGTIDARAAADSDGRMVEGATYIAMELAARGALSDCPPPRRWREARDLLLAKLHSHEATETRLVTDSVYHDMGVGG